MAKKTKTAHASRSNNEIRSVILRYFYDRNAAATSARGKKGYAVKITDVRKELKASHSLSQQEVMSNLNYLLSQGWVEEDKVEKSVSLPSGTVIPNTTSYYKITAVGIDKIEGPGEFSMDKFKGIKIEATGQNIITLGDGNQINAQFNQLGTALVELRYAITKSQAAEAEKMALVADIDTIQSQLAKPTPNKAIVSAAWETVKGAAAIGGCADLVGKVAALIAGLMA
jgi:hypothetical protein